MTPPLKQTQGFTLIELLVVIAIIGILIGFIAVGLPRALEAAKIAKLDNTFLQIRNILTEYFVDHGGTFPPAYGYLTPAARGVDPGVILSAPDADFFFLKPWMAYLGQHNNLELYDNFSRARNTDRDGDISRLEYASFGILDNPATQTFSFFPQLYDPNGNPNDFTDVFRNDLLRQFDSQGPRPILYFPINMAQFRKVASVWYRLAREDNRPDNPRPNDAELVNGRLRNMRFPPPTYDAYVLISVGPSANTWGMIYEFASTLMDQTQYSPAYYYHVLAMATYFMATRDAENRGEGDGELDFDFRARTRRGQVDSRSNYLPDPDAPRAYGPMIFVGEG